MKKEELQAHFPVFWDVVKDVIDEDGWVYVKRVPHLLDMYFEAHTGIDTEYQASYENEWEGDYWKGARWRPITIKDSQND
jgi:hypothetical protein